MAYRVTRFSVIPTRSGIQAPVKSSYVVDDSEKEIKKSKGNVYDFVKNNREKIDSYILKQVPNASIDDEERESWVLNDEYLYNLAKSEGYEI